MSIDKSLVPKGKLVRHRSVLTRTERVQHLTDEGLWDETKSVYGLPT
jgi:small basic protein (TIGR04137 family)